VRQCTKFAQASSEGRPIFIVDAASKGAVDIAALTQELVAAACKNPPTAQAGPGERSGATGSSEAQSGHRAAQAVAPAVKDRSAVA
jgi:hypothetical protein